MHNFLKRVGFTAVILTAPSFGAAQVGGKGSQVEQLRAKLAVASSYIEVTWKEFFAGQTPTPPFPRLVAYQNNVQSGCGVLEPGNAFFCAGDNTVYFDEILLAKLTWVARAFVIGPNRYDFKRYNLTDGHYGAVVALAHEYGHGVRYWQDRKQHELCLTGDTMRPGCIHSVYLADSGYALEAQADCYAGAITKHFKEDNLLSSTDFEEGKFVLGFLGDKKEPEMDSWMRRFVYSHGRAPDRERHFDIGYRSGASACVHAEMLIRNDTDKTPPDPSWQNPFKKFPQK